MANPTRTFSGSYPTHPQVAVGAVVFKEDEILLVLRGKPPSKNLWSIPGGSVKLGETLQQAVEREIGEETGLTITAREPIYTFDVVERDEEGRIRLHYVIVDLAADYVRGELRPGDDAIDARWVSPEDAKNLEVSPATANLLNNRFGFEI